MGQHIYNRNGIDFTINLEPSPKGFTATIDNPKQISETENTIKTGNDRAKAIFQDMYKVKIENPGNKPESEVAAFIQKQIDKALDREAAIRNTLEAKKGENVVVKMGIRQREDQAINEKIESEAKNGGLKLDGNTLRLRILDQIPEELIQKRMNELKAEGADVDHGRMEFTFAAKTKDGAAVSFNLRYNLNDKGLNMDTLSEDQKAGITEVMDGLQRALAERTQKMYAAELKAGRQIREKFLDGVQTDILGPALNRMKDLLPGIEAIGGGNAAREALSTTPPTAVNGPTMVVPQPKP